MANGMIVRQSQVPGLRSMEVKLSRQVVRHMQRMEEIAEAAKVAMDEVSETTGYSAHKAASTLTFADLIRQAAKARGISPTEEAAYQRLTQEYLNALNHIVNSANTQILLSLDRLPVDGNGSLLDEFLDGLLGR